MYLHKILPGLLIMWGFHMCNSQSSIHGSPTHRPMPDLTQFNNELSNSVEPVSPDQHENVGHRQDIFDESDDDEGCDEESVEDNSSSPTSSLEILASPTPDTETARRHNMQSLIERSRQLRLMTFQQDILSGLGIQNPPMVNSQYRNSVLRRLRYQEDMLLPLADIPEERVCYSATCGVPKSTNSSLWTNITQPGIRLYFDVPRQSRGRDEEVKSAKLKLFVKPNRECPCYDENGDPLPRQLVSVYQFIRPLSIRRRNRVVYRKRLLDAVMIPAQGNVWVSLNIKRAMTTWVTRSRRNFGIEITIKDANETLVNSRDLFIPPDCSPENERTCRDDNGQTVEEMSWAPPRLRDSVVAQNTPYVDIVIVDRTAQHELLRQQQQQQVLLRRFVRGTRYSSRPRT